MFHKATLHNGIRLVAETVPEYRSVAIGAWVCAGTRDEPAGAMGISHFLEHMHFKGTARRSAQDIANEIDSLGGELNAFTSREGTTYYVKVLDQHLEQGLDLLGDLFSSSRLDPEDIEREKGPVIEEINMVEDTPDDIIHDLLYQNAWPAHGLGHSILGTKETVAGFVRGDLTRYVSDHYTVGETVLAAAGNFSFDRLLNLLNETFGRLGRRGERSPRIPPAFQGGTWVYPRDLAEVHLCFGLEGLSQSHDDRYALYVLNTILGSGVSSRLFQEIREKRGLAYSVYSYLASYVDTGLLGVYAGTGPDRAREVVRLVIGELRRLLAGVVPAEDARRAKEQLKGSLILGLESTNSRMSQIARDEIYFGRRFTVEDILRGIEAVTPERILETARMIVADRGLSLVALGPVPDDHFHGEDLTIS